MLPTTGNDFYWLLFFDCCDMQNSNLLNLLNLLIGISSCDSLNPSIVSDNNKFWKTIKSVFSDKRNYDNKKILVKNGKIADNNTDISSKIQWLPLKFRKIGI